MSRGQVRRVEKLEEVVERDRVRRKRVIGYFFDPQTGERFYFNEEDDPARGRKVDS